MEFLGSSSMLMGKMLSCTTHRHHTKRHSLTPCPIFTAGSGCPLLVQLPTKDQHAIHEFQSGQRHWHHTPTISRGKHFLRPVKLTAASGCPLKVCRGASDMFEVKLGERTMHTLEPFMPTVAVVLPPATLMTLPLRLTRSESRRSAPFSSVLKL